MKRKANPFDRKNDVPWPERGSPELSPAAKEYLDARGISFAYAKRAGLRSYTAAETHAYLGILSPALAVPYPELSGEFASDYGAVRLLAEQNDGSRFRRPAGAPNRLYLAPPARDGMAAWAEVARDTKAPLLGTEGEIKAMAGSLAGHHTFALAGVDCWLARYNGKDSPSEALREFDSFDWRDRYVEIAYDSDALTKTAVQRALLRFCADLASRGARPHIVLLPAGPNGAKVGLDDFLATHTPAQLRALPRHDWQDPRFEAWGVSDEPKNTDSGNATRFVIEHGDRSRYAHDLGSWYLWADHYWRPDKTKEVYDLAAATVRAMHREVVTMADREAAKALSAWAVGSESARALGAMLSLAATRYPIRTTAATLDADPLLVAAKNVVLDLRTGKPTAARPEQHITKLLGCAYDPKAKPVRWLKFLKEVMGGDAEMVAFLRRMVGYMLTGLTVEQCLFFLHGSGANGKSVLVNIVKALLGDYARQVQAESLMLRDRGGGINNDIARLHGARLALATETEEGQRLAESLIKQLTGQDTVSARFLYQEHFEFVPQFKVVIVGNHRPVIRGDDFAIWRRMRLVPFDVTFPADKQDRTLPAKLHDELPGVLNWALDGCIEWQSDGLRPPKKVLDATAEYRSDSDPLEQFFAAECERGDDPKTYRVAARELYQCYRRWASASGHREMTETSFGLRVKDRGYKTKKIGAKNYYLGLRVRFRGPREDQP